MGARLDNQNSVGNMRFIAMYHLLGVFIILSVGGPLHFLYEWMGNNRFIASVAPINESIWEHLKLVYWPILLYWVAGYILFKRRKNLSYKRWFQAMAISITLSMIIVVVWYYTWKGAFAIEATWVNFSSLLGVPLSQLIAIHAYRVVKSRWIYFIPSAFVVISIGFMLIYFTYYPPSSPLFISPV